MQRWRWLRNDCCQHNDGELIFLERFCMCCWSCWWHNWSCCPRGRLLAEMQWLRAVWAVMDGTFWETKAYMQHCCCNRWPAKLVLWLLILHFCYWFVNQSYHSMRYIWWLAVFCNNTAGLLTKSVTLFCCWQSKDILFFFVTAVVSWIPVLAGVYKSLVLVSNWKILVQGSDCHFLCYRNTHYVENVTACCSYPFLRFPPALHFPLAVPR